MKIMFGPTWKHSLASITRFFGFSSRVAKEKEPLLVVYRDESNLKNAMLTIRMALNPGEVLNADVAARIRREAEAYEQFLRSPGKVGRIVVNVKEFAGGGQTCVSREQLRINQPLEGLNDPTEGRAGFFYRFARSADTVLEFVVHDENDQPLFPLVRTYTNWVASKELDLGFGRKFYLALVEGNPGYVQLRAGFAPVAEESFDFVPERQPAVAACAGVTPGVSLSGGPCYSLAVSQPAGAVACMVIMMIMLGAALLTVHSFSWPTAKASVPKTVTQGQNSSLNMASESIWLTQAEPVAGNSLTISPVDDQQTTTASSKKSKTVIRLADIRRFKVSVDSTACHGKCLKVLNGIHRQLKFRLDGLNLPPAEPEAVTEHKPSANVVVSYLPVDEERGRIHVTLSDHEGSLLDLERYFEHLVNTDSQTTDLYSEQVTAEVLATVFRAKDQCLSETDRVIASKEETK